MRTETITLAAPPGSQRVVYKFSKLSRSWSPVVTLPFDVCEASLAYVGGRIYIVGGMKLNTTHFEDGYYFEPTNSSWVFDVSSQKCWQGPSLPINSEDGLKGYAKGSTFLLAKEEILVYSGGVQLSSFSLPRKELMLVSQLFCILCIL